MSIFLIVLAGAFGALAKDIVSDNKITLPKKTDGDFCLGFIGGMLVGGFCGYAIDGSPVTAAMAGYTGSSVIAGLISIEKKSNTPEKETIENIIRIIAKEEMVDPDLAVRVAKCESGLDPNAKHENEPGSIDRGIFQINSKHHPEVTDEQAKNIEFSTRFFCKAFKNGNLDWWKATKKCWDIDNRYS